jgi:hypothetical protein
MLLKSSILARPGWSPLNFDLLLGEPDERRHVSAAPSAMRLYTLERVLAAEASLQFQELKQKVKVTRFHIPRHLVSDNDFAAELLEMPIDVIIFTVGRVREGAIGHHNATRSADFVTRRSDNGLLNRAMFEYARDILTRYDRGFEARASAAGASVVVRAIRNTVCHAIASTYPALSGECFVQPDRSA